MAPAHLEQAAAFARRQAQATPVTVRTLSSLPLERQVGAEGATWLDRELVAETPEPVRDEGFGRDVRAAQARRRQWLIAQELAREEPDRIVYRAHLLGILRRPDLVRVAGQLSGALGMSCFETKCGEAVGGAQSQRAEPSQ